MIRNICKSFVIIDPVFTKNFMNFISSYKAIQLALYDR